MLVFRSELDPVSVRLLKVVANDLVRSVAAEPRFQPVREALVQLGPEPLRQRVVCGVADQDVAEAETVIAGKHRLLRADQPLAHERHQMPTYPWARLSGSDFG